jgi:hypothetical protein
VYNVVHSGCSFHCVRKRGGEGGGGGGGGREKADRQRIPAETQRQDRIEHRGHCAEGQQVRDSSARGSFGSRCLHTLRTHVYAKGLSAGGYKTTGKTCIVKERPSSEIEALLRPSGTVTHALC